MRYVVLLFYCLTAVWLLGTVGESGRDLAGQPSCPAGERDLGADGLAALGPVLGVGEGEDRSLLRLHALSSNGGWTITRSLSDGHVCVVSQGRAVGVDGVGLLQAFALPASVEGAAPM